MQDDYHEKKTTDAIELTNHKASENMKKKEKSTATLEY